MLPKWFVFIKNALYVVNGRARWL